MKIFRIILIAGILIGLLLSAVPAYATAISQPDSPGPSITLESIHVNRNLVVTGDVCIFGLYNIPYATLPTTVDPTWTADKAFLFRLIDTDNITELGSITPFVYFAGGYRTGVFSFYFPASANMTSTANWGKAYKIRISENPALFATPFSWDTTIPSPAYTIFTTQADNQGDMADRVIQLTQTLQSIYTSYTLWVSSGGRTVLASGAGEGYFRGAIRGLQAMAPRVYLVQQSEIDYTPTVWRTDNFDAYTARFNGTWIGTATTATATQFGIPAQLVTSLPILLICLGFVIFSSLLVRKIEPGWVISCLILIMGALLGWIPMAVFAVIYQVMAIYLAWIWFGSKLQWVQFIAVVWFASTLICLIIEGSYFTASHNTILNDLTVISNLNIGDLLTIPATTLTFFRGLVRMFLFDYSFYAGSWVIVRAFCIIVFGSGIVYNAVVGLASLAANFIPGH